MQRRYCAFFLLKKMGIGSGRRAPEIWADKLFLRRVHVALMELELRQKVKKTKKKSSFLLPESLVRRSGAIFISSSSLIFHPFLGMCPLAIIGLWASGEKA